MSEFRKALLAAILAVQAAEKVAREEGYDLSVLRALDHATDPLFDISMHFGWDED